MSANFLLSTFLLFVCLKTGKLFALYPLEAFIFNAHKCLYVGPGDMYLGFDFFFHLLTWRHKVAFFIPPDSEFICRIFYPDPQVINSGHNRPYLVFINLKEREVMPYFFCELKKH